MITNLKIYKPVNASQNVITSRFNAIRWYGRLPVRHRAYDFAPHYPYRKTPQDIIAGIRSRVVLVYNDGTGFGLYLKLKPIDFPCLIIYKAHLKTTYVKQGEIVDAKQKIALMGNTGNSWSMSGGDGTHLHEECRQLISRGNFKKIDLANYYKFLDWNETFRI